MFPHLSLPSLLIISFLAILFFGKDNLPDLAKSAGKSIKEFKKAISETVVTDNNIPSEKATQSEQKAESKNDEV